jgi:hypothetical protein
LKILILNGILIVEVVNQNDTDDSAFPPERNGGESIGFGIGTEKSPFITPNQ